MSLSLSENIYVCLLHIICACALHNTSRLLPRFLCLYDGFQPACCLPSAFYLPPYVLAFLCAFALYACLHALAKFNRPTEHNARLQFLCIPGWERRLGKNIECLALKSKHQHLLLLFREMMLSMFRVARVGGKIVSALHVIVRGPNPLWTDHCLPLWTHFQVPAAIRLGMYLFTNPAIFST